MENHFESFIRRYAAESSDVRFEPVPYGLTNITTIVVIDGKKYVARIYNPHIKSIAGIELESRIASYLNKEKLSFQVPQFVRTHTNEEIVKLPDGRLGAVVTFLEGSPPRLETAEQAEAFGHVVGEFSSALNGYDSGDSGEAGTSFLDYDRLHPLGNRGAVEVFMERTPFVLEESEKVFFIEMLKAVERNKVDLNELPRQLVHHDLLVYNLLAEDERISGLLDFDFLSVDIGFMEFAISLNHVLQMSEGSLDMAEAFVHGYAGCRKGTSEEIGSLQLLTQIYHIAVLHIYIGQHLAGAVIEPQFRYILRQFRTRNDWFTAHGATLKTLLEHYLL